MALPLTRALQQYLRHLIAVLGIAGSSRKLENFRRIKGINDAHSRLRGAGSQSWPRDDDSRLRGNRGGWLRLSGKLRSTPPGEGTVGDDGPRHFRNGCLVPKAKAARGAGLEERLR